MTENEKPENVVNGLEWLLENMIDTNNDFRFAGYDGPAVLANKPIIEDALALLKAQEAQEAQEAVEPIFNAMVETEMSYWSCGACGAFIYGNAYPHMVKDNIPKYCGYCGRAVKW